MIKLVNSINESIKAKIGEENKAEAKVKICPFCKEEINIGSFKMSSLYISN
ncbi:hypothetical protein SD457_21090 [Coprobacillaceae bacterium CR2/5/TPMF4]|nr:hypothetical protein SD457_21090 [Coprobacillaceae bacterium CR2/5/TPMF4]